jgi:hypothetical protein
MKKMKNIFKSLLIITVMSLGVIACDEDETVFTPLDFPTDAFISIEGSSVSVLESVTTPIEVKVNYSNTVAGSTAPVTVDFTISSANAVEGTHYTINKNQISFPVGVFSDIIVITPIDNFDEDGDKVLNFSLGASTVNVGYPGPDAFGTSIDLTLVDDDCAWAFEDLDGIEWIGTDNSGGEGPNATQIKTFYDGTDLLMEGIAYGWLTNPGYWDEVVVVSNPVIVDMDPVSGVFTIDEQYLCSTTWLGNPQPDYSISATGQYFSCLQSMEVNYTLYQGGGVLRQYTETIEF